MGTVTDCDLVLELLMRQLASLASAWDRKTFERCQGRFLSFA